ncbi:MAG TPA: electron transport complex subunit RsxC [Methylococcus sp.]|nr:electron transport complex subunit RsxC [Methylococcus sp.]
MLVQSLAETVRKLGRELRIRGGVHAEGRKTATAGQPIAMALPLPERFYIPLQQHIGQPAEPVVGIGQRVRKGDLLAHSQGMLSAPVHAPTSGTVIDITDHPAPHPSVLPIRTIIIEADGLDEAPKPGVPIDPMRLDPGEICARIGAAGIVGMGGAAFPSAVKLESARQRRVHTLLINGGECEPYLTCDDRLMRERGAEIVDGIRLMLHGMQAPRAVVVIEDNKPEALRAMADAASPFPQIGVVEVPTRYPMGWERQLIRYVIGKEVPADKLAADVGVLIHNVATAYAVHRAIRHGEPLIRRVVTVSGGAVAQPVNVEAPLGTLLSELLRFCGWDPARTARLVIGGPMMGEAIPHADVPLVKGVNGLLALSPEEVASAEAQPCIRCGRCVTACPVGLLPLEMASRIRAGRFDGAVDYGLRDCIQCGSCAYVCPSNLPLVHYFKYGKGILAARQKLQEKTEKTRKLAEARQSRIEREKRERKGAAV